MDSLGNKLSHAAVSAFGAAVTQATSMSFRNVQEENNQSPNQPSPQIQQGELFRKEATNWAEKKRLLRDDVHTTTIQQTLVESPLLDSALACDVARVLSPRLLYASQNQKPAWRASEPYMTSCSQPGKLNDAQFQRISLSHEVTDTPQSSGICPPPSSPARWPLH